MQKNPCTAFEGKWKNYCFLGNGDEFLRYGVKKAEQTDLKVTAFTTEYSFDADGVCLKVSFVSPLPLNDLDLLSLPVCYMEYEVVGAQDAEVSLFINKRVPFSDWFETKTGEYHHFIARTVQGGCFILLLLNEGK